MSDQDPSNPPQAPRTPIDPTGTATPPPPPPGYVPAVYVQHPTSGKGATKIIMYLLMVGLLVSITINIYLFGPVAILLKSLSSTSPPEADFWPVVEPSEDKDRVVVVEISGAINAEMADYASKVFYSLTKDPPKAVVLRVVSGGGGVTASDQIWNAIKQFREEHEDVPVIASFGSVAASGGYYIAAPADKIYVERTGITGSIGVLAQLPALGGMIEKLGVEMNMVIASQSPKKDDANNLFISWYPSEGEEGVEVVVGKDGDKDIVKTFTPDGAASYKVISNLVDGAYETFFSVVKDGRTAADSSITEAELRKAANGAIFTGQDAVDVRLADEVGYLEDAIAHAIDESGLDEDDAKVKIIRKPAPGFLGSLAKRNAGFDLTNFTGEELRNLVEDATAIRLEYRMRSPR